MVNNIEELKNHYKITEHSFICNNQNGFNQSLYDYFKATNKGEDNSFSKLKVREMLQNYPTHYPCFLIIVDVTFECSRIYIEAKNISRNDYQTFINILKI